MKKAQIYFIMSIASIVLTFTTAMGVFLSLILINLIKQEKLKLSNKYLVGNENELRILKNARIINIINLVINGIIIFYISLMFLVTYLKSPPGHNMWQ